MGKTDLEFNSEALDLVKKLNSFHSPGSSKEKCFKFVIDGQTIGYVLPKIVNIFKSYNECFIVDGDAISLNTILKTSEEKTIAIEKVLIDVKEKKLIKKLDGWRNEHFNVKPKFSEPTLFTIERAAACLFGFKQYGCHVNGYIKDDDRYFIWIAKRSKTKQTYPGMLDNITGGGLTAGLEVMECAKKELQEEAGLSEEMTSSIKSVDAITYAYEEDEGISFEGEFIFDIQLPNYFEPNNTDGEVEEFYLMDINQVKEAITSDKFKPNSAAVTLGFLIRKGLICPDKTPNYLEILEKLHLPGI